MQVQYSRKSNGCQENLPCENRVFVFLKFVIDKGEKICYTMDW